MRTAADQVQAHRAPLHISGASPLSKPVQGLSARRMEELFQLPTGAWHQRHLYGLRLLVDGYADFGLKRGDLLLIEPGQRQPRGKLVVTRHLDGEVGLRRINEKPNTAPGETTHHSRPQLDESLWLPLKEAPAVSKERTIGVVISVARPTQNGVLRPLFPRRRRVPSTTPLGTGPSQEGREQIENALDALRSHAAKWKIWVDAQATALGQDSKLIQGWHRLESSLVTLIQCIEVAHSPRLAAALNREARCVVRTMQGEISRSKMTGRTRLCA